jgi:hypothetical protein
VLAGRGGAQLANDREHDMRSRTTTLAGALLATLAIAGCGGSDSGGISPKAKKDFIAGCTQAGQPQKGCECIFSELEKQGVDTKKEFEALASKVKKATSAADVPDEFRKAAVNCKDKLKQQ